MGKHKKRQKDTAKHEKVYIISEKKRREWRKNGGWGCEKAGDGEREGREKALRVEIEKRNGRECTGTCNRRGGSGER